MTPLVLLHYLGGSRREWDAVGARLADDRPVLALDLPGFGEAADRAPRDVAGMAEWLAEEIADAGFDPCVVVGHSMSAKVAMVLASTTPSRLKGLVLLTASPPAPEPMDAKARNALLAFDGSREAATDYVDGVIARPVAADRHAIAVEDAMRASPSAWKAWVEAGSREDWSDRIGTLAMPACVIAGSADPSLGEAVQRRLVLPHLPHGRLVVIAGGHLLPIENPDALHREIRDFLETSVDVP